MNPRMTAFHIIGECLLQVAWTQHLAENLPNCGSCSQGRPGWLLSWPQYLRPGPSPHDIHWERVREDAENWCCLPWPNGCLWHDLAHWPSLQIIQVSPVLVRSYNGASAMESPVLDPHGGRCQLLLQAGEWTSFGLCSGPNTLQLIYQRLPCHTQPQVYLCRPHLLCLPNWNFLWDWMHFNRWPCLSCQILSAVASKTLHVQDRDKCFPRT